VRAHSAADLIRIRARPGSSRRNRWNSVAHGRFSPTTTGMTWLLLVLIVILVTIVQIRFRPPATRPLTAAEADLVTRLRAELQRALDESSHQPANDLRRGLARMKLRGVLIDPGDCNALTWGRRTYFTEFFFQGKTRCQQLKTLLWEALRVAGNYVEDDDWRAYAAAERDVDQTFLALAPRLGCLHDLPPGLATYPPRPGTPGPQPDEPPLV
jgi:hypothetical protein